MQESTSREAAGTKAGGPRITVIMGSPRRQNTLRLVQVIEDELKSLCGATFEYVQLSEHRIETCRGCMACLARGFEHCPIDDDVDGIMEMVGLSDGVILASPVYIYQVTAQTKLFLDRLAAFCHRPAFFDKQAMAVSTTGAFGTGKVLSYMKGVLGVLGFRSVVTVGGRGTDYDGGLPASLEKKARRAARRFHRNLQKDGRIEPSLGSVLQFRMQRLFLTTDVAARLFPADFEHYRALEGRPYPVDARINPFKRIIARTVEVVARPFVR